MEAQKRSNNSWYTDIKETFETKLHFFDCQGFEGLFPHFTVHL